MGRPWAGLGCSWKASPLCFTHLAPGLPRTTPQSLRYSMLEFDVECLKFKKRGGGWMAARQVGGAQTKGKPRKGCFGDCRNLSFILGHGKPLGARRLCKSLNSSAVRGGGSSGKRRSPLGFSDAPNTHFPRPWAGPAPKQIPLLQNRGSTQQQQSIGKQLAGRDAVILKVVSTLQLNLLCLLVSPPSLYCV